MSHIKNNVKKKFKIFVTNQNKTYNLRRKTSIVTDMSKGRRTTLLTWLIKWHRRRRMEEWGIMVERRAIAKFELAICCRKVWEPRRPFLEPSW